MAVDFTEKAKRYQAMDEIIAENPTGKKSLQNFGTNTTSGQVAHLSFAT